VQQYLIVAFREGEADRCHVLAGEPCVIGRTSEADLRLPDSTISRRHAVVQLDDDRIVIEDRDSTNGVFINGERVARSIVRQGDFLTLGAYTLVVRALDESSDDTLPRGKTVCVSRGAREELQGERLKGYSPEHVRAFYRVALLLGDALEVDALLQRVLDIVVATMHAHRGAVLLRTDDPAGSRLAAHVPPRRNHDELAVSRTLVDYVLRSKTALLTEKAQADPRFWCSDSTAAQNVGAAMCVPLCGASQSIGALYVDAGEEELHFDEADLEFLTAMGHVVGMAVENKSLDQKIVKQEQFAALGRAVAGISHDVRSVLSGITIGVNLLESSCEEEGRKGTRNALGIVRKSADQVEKYLTDLLKFVTPSELHPTPTYIRGLIEDVLDTMRPRATEQGVELVFCGGGFEPANVDGPQMQRVLQNIVGNAVDACAADGGTVAVSVGWRGDTLSIQVSDTGTGISAENIPRLSEPFYTTKGGAGTGLGLAIGYRIVEQHGGRVVVTSEPGQGSVFTVVIPDCSTARVAEGDRQSEHEVLDGIYRRCPGCCRVWASQDRFLMDPEVSVAGYQVNFDELRDGLFLFNHSCGTMLALPTGEFRHLYDGPIYEERRTGTTECPGYCLRKDETRPCPAECECAYVREVLQIVRDRRRKRNSS